MTHHNWSMFQLTTHTVSALVVFSPVCARSHRCLVTNSCDHLVAQVTLKKGHLLYTCAFDKTKCLPFFPFFSFPFCLCLTIHIATALHLFSACTLDVISTVMTRMHVRSSMRAHSPLSGSSVNESCAQDTEQKHGKHGSGAPLSSFPLLLVVVLAEHGGCLSSVDRDRDADVEVLAHKIWRAEDE